MAKNIEIEFKNILSREEYQRLFDALSFENQSPLKQRNIYFDTADGKLKNQMIGLRTRITDHYVHVTMKQPVANHQKLETTDKLTLDEGADIVASGKIDKAPEIEQVLQSLGVNLADLVVTGQFQTTRYETIIEGNTIVLDHCNFAHFEDYELEVESTEVENGRQFFADFLQKFQINQRPAKQKIVRMTQKFADITE